MFSKLSKNSSVKNILVITLSNIGDVIATALVVDILLRDFPEAKLSLMTGDKPKSLFENNPKIHRIHIYDKTRGWWEQFKWILSLRVYRYDLVVDLRNSMIGFFLTPKWITAPILKSDRHLHMKDRHLHRLGLLYEYDPLQAPMLAIKPSPADEQMVHDLCPWDHEKFVLIAPRAADLAKTWDPQNFVALSEGIAQLTNLKIVMIGSAYDVDVLEDVRKKSQATIINLAGKVNLIQTVQLIKKAAIIISHDSGPMHIASYFNKPVVALFGPTEPEFSHPWGKAESKVICHKEQCPRCQNPQREISHECMKAICVEEVLDAFKGLYEKIY